MYIVITCTAIAAICAFIYAWKQNGNFAMIVGGITGLAALVACAIFLQYNYTLHITIPEKEVAYLTYQAISDTPETALQKEKMRADYNSWVIHAQKLYEQYGYWSLYPPNVMTLKIIFD